MDERLGARVKESPSGALSESQYAAMRFEQATRTMRLREPGERRATSVSRPVLSPEIATTPRAEPATKAPAASPARHPRATIAAADAR